MSKEALQRVAEKLRRAGATLPAPQITGTIEGSVISGLSIALAVVEAESEALAAPQPAPEGWKPVPLTPTREMEQAWIDAAAGPDERPVVAGYRAMLAAAPQPAQPADEALTQALQERDTADDYIDALLDEVLGADRPEWSSAYGRTDAIEQVRERMTVLMKAQPAPLDAEALRHQELRIQLDRERLCR